MSFEQTLHLWSESTPVSALIWLGILLILLYLGRASAHRLLQALGLGLRQPLRRLARGLRLWRGRLRERNADVILRLAVDNQERLLEREFSRVRTLVERDLAAYPSLQRQLHEQINRVDADYRHSVEEPPTPPAWLEAVDAIARIPAHGDPMVGKILGDIHHTLERACHEAISEYRAASRKRHLWLKRMLPYWRRLNQTLKTLEQGVGGLDARARSIDEYMGEYQQLRAMDAADARNFAPSNLKQFLLGAGALGILGLAAWFAQGLLQAPLRGLFAPNMPQGGSLGAWILLLVQFALGLFLWECLRATRMLPFVGRFDDRLRHILARLCALGLVLLPCAAALVLLGGNRPNPGEPLLLWLLILPLALTAIPLESALQSGRVLGGLLLEALLAALAWIALTLGDVLVHLSRLLMRVYDLLIFLPLGVERTLHQRGAGRRAPPPDSAAESARAHGGERP
ncbi:hypothetical protein [Alkalilimnicola sp. S0819]|uniref:hypothetical protein n=1 Tax=Alkalilimnicola sp. S0819 TaxID=2613922 RepID=UPI0012622D6F|nr:hypothetical protein [Alkalilimnicola sp. S0819]KAB7628392.1 hypothetical protein F3N43_01465 [Alkalilimnicola sp. S0819]MPQ15295.1 hypothetical protein [Alkalilimnicola sp. S0819]